MDFCNSDSLYYVFGQIIRLHFQCLHNMLDKYGMYPGQPPLLFALYHRDGQSQKELAMKLNIKPATITVMLRRMEKTGLLLRKQDEEDQRISRVYITEKGREICKELKQVMIELNDECFKNFTEEEKDALYKLLIKMQNNLINVRDYK
ncbi:transcriptional regulator, MarR family [Caloramator quimbayensis]|uniref:Transcriptional regulator, MarR family n=1 Tax=Caloramator quimbayensis TaxID=1147123 RepID=A0A1T4WRX4_9CLOT|nr:MarR family transcriptional regulator [Caloramator quimbayensis]SKA79605.1 transcriptional regulator, MarR family [Caloramator quimbayensis]